MAADPEAKVFRQYKTQLAVAISDSLLEVASECHARELINQAYDDVKLPNVTPKDKAVILLDAIEKYIATDPANYEKFMTILNDKLPSSCDKVLVDMAEALRVVRDSGRKSRRCTDSKSAKGCVVDVPKAPSCIKVTSVPRQKPVKDVTHAGADVRKRGVSHSESSDSGVSVGRSDSSVSDRDRTAELAKLDSVPEDVQPVEEIPLQSNSEIQQERVESNTTIPPGASSNMSDQLLSFAHTAMCLSFDAKQKEAQMISLEKECERLKKELDNTVSKRNEVEDTLVVREKELSKLKEERKKEKALLERNDDVIDGLKSRLSSSETDREKLRSELKESKLQHDKKIRACEDEVNELKIQIRDYGQTIVNLRHQLEKKNHEAGLVCQSGCFEKLQLKEAEVQATKDELKRCRERHCSEREFARQREYFIVCLLVVVIAFLMYLYIYKDSHCGLSAVTSKLL